MEPERVRRKRIDLELRVRRLEGELRYARSDLEALQLDCAHPATADSGLERVCGDCGRRWPVGGR